MHQRERSRSRDRRPNQASESRADVVARAEYSCEVKGQSVVEECKDNGVHLTPREVAKLAECFARGVRHGLYEPTE